MNDTSLATLSPSDLWDDYRPTPLLELPRLARLTGVRRVFVKAEGERPLGNFKVLGGMVAGLRTLARATGVATLQDLTQLRAQGGSLPKLICASDGNHGLAVAAAARRVGSGASIYLPRGVSQWRADRIETYGGEVIWSVGTYDDAVLAAAAAAKRGDGILVPDTTTDPLDPVVQDVMAGYAILTKELVSQFRNDVHERPSHMFIQAGVGGLAAAMLRGLLIIMQNPSSLVVVEPKSAACVARAIVVGRPERLVGELQTSAEMLSCGLASAPALEILRWYNPRCVVVDEEQLTAAVTCLHDVGGPDTTASGAAGLAGFLHVATRPDFASEHQLNSSSVVLLVATESRGAA